MSSKNFFTNSAKALNFLLFQTKKIYFAIQNEVQNKDQQNIRLLLWMHLDKIQEGGQIVDLQTKD